MGMNRREFFKMTGLGMGSAFLLPGILSAAWTDQWNAEEAVAFAVAHARANGATYADACIGPCEVHGHKEGFAPVGLLDTDLLGMRICTPQGWRMVLLRDFSKAAIQRDLTPALEPAPEMQNAREHWLVAHFPNEKILAKHSSDTSLSHGLHGAQLRYGRPLDLPSNLPDTLFCDIITLH